IKQLLLVDDDEIESSKIIELMGNTDINVTHAKSGKEAIKLIQKEDFDCIVLDILSPGSTVGEIMTSADTQMQLQRTSLIVYSNKELSKKEEAQVNRLAKSIIHESENAIGYLLDQTSLFLHRAHSDLLPETRRTIENYRLSEDVLQSKTVLLVDDDVRNLFALTAALERYKINIISAESGLEAIHHLQKRDNIDIVLMDIMMPEMDGYETMKNIRKDAKNMDIPIIAVTAKAMKGDRQKCIESGATDYITKPVNVNQLLTLMRAWLKK
ncbi:MAG: response regulator, partial [Bacteroidetes bacterium]|nr:response regulator [Bacteroidota bacterium]